MMEIKTLFRKITIFSLFILIIFSLIQGQNQQSLAQDDQGLAWTFSYEGEAVSADFISGEYAVATYEQYIDIVNINTDEILFSIEHDAVVDTLAVSDNQQYIATATLNGDLVYVCRPPYQRQYIGLDGG